MKQGNLHSNGGGEALTSEYVMVIGLGEIGAPLLDIIGEKYTTIGVDVEPKRCEKSIAIMHVCYAYQDDDFVDTTVQYVKKYSPQLTIINSTVIPGTTRAIEEKTMIPVIYSPVRGKHYKMKSDLLTYTKYIAGVDSGAVALAAQHFHSLGMETKTFGTPECLELAKIVSTTYFGLLIAWAQEIERFCKKCNVDYDEVLSFTKEIDYFPPVIFTPGHIGGHCIIPNIHLLKKVRESEFLDLIIRSNEEKIKEWVASGRSLDERVTPKCLK